MKKLLFLSLNILIATSIFAQQGKDGAPNITATTTVNIYTPLALPALAGTTTISVANAAGFSAGDLIYIIQMQGATVNAYAYLYGNKNEVNVRDTSTGKVKAYNGAGDNEFAEIASVSGNVLTLNCGLKVQDSFSVVGKTQVIRVPRYDSLTLSVAGQITCPPWNGSTGGVVVVEVKGNTTIGSGTSFNVTGKGFRGGVVLNYSNMFGGTNVGYNYTTHNGARKGESIAGDTIKYKDTSDFYNPTAFYLSVPMPTCKGNVANGGGGGNVMNCGGGGGSNGGVISQWNGMGNANTTYSNCWALESTTPLNGSFRPTTSSGGGRGGYAYSSSNADPTLHGPGDGTAWSSDSRHNDGGWGGIPLDYSNGKIFLGGGGGAGDENNNSGTDGGNGGGIVYLLSYGKVSGAGQILADGATALNTNTPPGTGTHGDDGAGGGGGGGAVFISSTGNIALTNTLSISAQGGGGGSFVARPGITTGDNFGPGGGGGGGYVATTNAVTGTNVNGGVNGTVVQNGSNNSKIANSFPPNGATSGGAGSIKPTSTPPFYLTAKNDTVCTSGAASLLVTVNGAAPSGLAVNWYTVTTGGTAVSSNNPYTFTAPATAGTYTYYAGTCPGTNRIPVILVVNSATPPTVTITTTNTLVCSGTNVILTASTSATSYTWSANAGSVYTNTTSVNPTSNPTTYTVTVANTGACASAGTSTASIDINVIPSPTITITPTSYSLCSGIKDTLKASSSSALTYTWSSNAGSATTSSVAISPNVGATTYTVTGSDGTCSPTQTIAINVTATPTVSTSPTNTTICKGSSATFTASGATTSYSWSTGTNTAVVSVSPTGNATYTVTGYNGTTCKDTATVSVTVDEGISSIDTTVTKANCNPANSGAIAINSVTGGIAPYQTNINGGTFNTISTFPYSFNSLLAVTYTVLVKDAIGCPLQSVINVGGSGSLATPTITPSGNTTFCQGGSVTLTSSSASSYTWMPGNISGSSAQTITVSTQGVYTVTIGSSAGCTAQDTITVNVNNNPETPVLKDTIITECQNNTHPIVFHYATGTLIIHNSLGQIQPLPFNPTSTSTYTAYDTLNGCVSAIKNITVNVNAAPTTAPTVTTPVTYCYGQVTDTLQALPTVSGGYIVWEDANHNVLNTPPAPSPSSTILDTTTYYVYQGVGSCPGKLYDSIKVIVLNKPSPSFTMTPSIGVSLNQNVSFSPIQTITGNTYYWNFDDATSSTNTSHSPLATHAYSLASTYCPKLVVINSLGCKDSTTLCLDILNSISLTIPNVFSPNGDGVNDVFSIKSIGIADLSCDIFDRWGLKLYSWNGVAGYWDGTEKTGKAVDGTYFYIVQTTDVKGVSQTNKGFIQLIK